MRRILLITPFLFVGLLCLGILFAGWLSASAHFHPGQSLFPLQESAEELRLRLINDPAGKANYALELLERRIADLARLADTPAEVPALQALDKALDRAQIISAASAKLKPDLMLRLKEMLERAVSLLSGLSIAPQKSPDLYTTVVTRALALHDMVSGVSAGGSQEGIERGTSAVLPLVIQSNAMPTPNASAEALADPQVVMFLPGSPGAQHEFFPLTGKHSILECASCHLEGTFAGTPRLCSACHADVRPASHYPGECSACHLTNAWRPANFNHSGQTNCQSCHTRPSGHYTGQCSACHSTNAWRPANFNHRGQTNCQSCHTRPSGHYSGQCSACHSTDAWRPANFDHNGQTDCQSCHTPPRGHYTGQCSACHSTDAWRPANFDHNGQTDCQSCHARPNGHWSGQCSSCHSTNSWGGVQVRGHTFPIYHKNADGVCSRCHPSNSPAYTCYNCHDRARMESKHAEKDIFDIANRCADCHPNGKKD